MASTRAGIKTVLFTLLWLLSLAALSIPFPMGAAAATAPERVLADGGAWFAAMLALGLLYRAGAQATRLLRMARLWVLAVFFAAVAVLGKSFGLAGTAELVSANPLHALVMFLGRVPAYCIGMALLLDALSRARLPHAGTRQATAMPAPAQAQGMARPAVNPGHGAQPGHAQAKTFESTQRLTPTWVWGLVILVCWMPYLFVVWPGTVSNDSITQLAEALGRKALSNGNPLAQTGLVWLMAQLGLGVFRSADAGVALYIGVQALLMAWLLGYAVRRLWEAGMPAWLNWLALLLYALCPVFPLFAFCVGKDTNFAMAVLWFTLMVWRVLGSKWPPLRTTAGLCLSAAACVLLRNAGAGLVGATLGVLFIRQFVKGGRLWRTPLLAMIVTTATLVGLYAFAVPALGALPTPATENWSIPLQQVARTVASVPLPDADRAAIDAVLPVEQIQPAYDGELSDPVKGLWREGVTPAQQADFFATWLRLGLRYPATYASATFHNSYGYLYPGYVNPVKPTFLLGMEGRTTKIDGAFDFTVNPLADPLKAQLKALFAYAPFRLLTAPGAYGWVLLLCVVGVLGYRRRENLIAMLPGLFALVGCLASAVNGYFRYAMPLYLLAPVLLGMLAQAARSGGREPRRRSPRLWAQAPHAER